MTSRRAVKLIAVILAALVGIFAAGAAAATAVPMLGSTVAKAAPYTYDGLTISRVDLHAHDGAAGAAPQLSDVREGSASTAAAATRASTPPSAACVATNTADDLAGAASRAASNVGPGSGSVYGTRVHSSFADEVAALGRSDLFSEVSYLNGQVVPYGTRGSVRLDVVVGSPSAPTAIWDLKTGSAVLTPQRIAQIQSHLPPGFQNVPVLEVRP